MVYQISGIKRRFNRESTSGGTIRKLPLTNRSGLGVLDNPHTPGLKSSELSSLQCKVETVLLNEDLESRNVASGCREKVKRIWKSAHIHNPCCEV